MDINKYKKNKQYRKSSLKQKLAFEKIISKLLTDLKRGRKKETKTENLSHTFLTFLIFCHYLSNFKRFLHIRVISSLPELFI